VKDTLRKIDTRLVIFQGRKRYSHGNKKCLLSLLKPNIGPDGNIYPCCGVQYLDKIPNRTFSETYSMGKITDIEKIYEEQRYFNGSVCDRCYYAEYNYAMNMMWGYASVHHREFI